MKPCHAGPERERLAGRKHDGPHSECEPCPNDHCAIDRRVHVDADERVCAPCLGAVRDNLNGVVRLTQQLPDEAVNRAAARQLPGGDALVMLGPSAHPEAWRNRAASALFGRADAAYLSDNRDEAHPLWILAAWETIWRDERHSTSDLKPSITRASDYLNEHLTWAARHHDGFPEFSDELSRCRSWLEAVLHEGSRDEIADAPCFDCRGDLARTYTKTGRTDNYECRRCRRIYTPAEYWIAARAKMEEQAG